MKTKIMFLLLSFFLVTAHPLFAGSPPHTALIVIDMQDVFIKQSGHYLRPENIEKVNEIQGELKEVISRAKRSGIPIFFVEYGPRQLHGQTKEVLLEEARGYPRVFTVVKFGNGLFDKDHVQLQTPSRNSDLSKSELLKVFADLEIRNLIVTGANGAACVERTISGALEENFNVVAYSHGVADFQESASFTYPYRGRYEAKFGVRSLLGQFKEVHTREAAFSTHFQVPPEQETSAHARSIVALKAILKNPIDAKALDSLALLARDRDPQIRLAAIKIFESSAAGELANHILYDLLENPVDFKMRIALLQAMGKNSGKIPDVLVGKVLGMRAQRKALEAHQEEEAAVLALRRKVAKQLSDLPISQAEPLIEKTIDSPGEDEAIVAEAVRALGVWRDSHSATLIIKFLNEGQAPLIVAAAAQALSKRIEAGELEPMAYVTTMAQAYHKHEATEVQKGLLRGLITALTSGTKLKHPIVHVWTRQENDPKIRNLVLNLVAEIISDRPRDALDTLAALKWRPDSLGNDQNLLEKLLSLSGDPFLEMKARDILYSLPQNQIEGLAKHILSKPQENPILQARAMRLLLQREGEITNPTKAMVKEALSHPNLDVVKLAYLEVVRIDKDQWGADRLNALALLQKKEWPPNDGFFAEISRDFPKLIPKPKIPSPDKGKG